jgi:hypothetical protein
LHSCWNASGFLFKYLGILDGKTPSRSKQLAKLIVDIAARAVEERPPTPEEQGTRRRWRLANAVFESAQIK